MLRFPVKVKALIKADNNNRGVGGITISVKDYS